MTATPTEPAPTPAPFDPSAPLPPLKPHPRKHSWEPAARHYRDIEPEEKAQA